MEQFVIYLALVLVGACFGSFAGATVWRIRAGQLVEDKADNEPYDKAEYRRLVKLSTSSTLSDRSCCLDCGYRLRWYDLIPIISWLTLRGKCRSCKKRIGWFELLIELGVAAFFVLSYAFWPISLDGVLPIIQFVLWLASGVAMAISFAYDTRWLLLPSIYTLLIAIFGVGITAISALTSGDVIGTIMQTLGSVAILGGLYWVLYAISNERWVGRGDAELGLALGLLLGSWELSLLALFLANLIGCLIVIPGLATKKLSRTSHVPFGPLLIAGAVLAWIFGRIILDGYYSLIGF